MGKELILCPPQSLETTQTSTPLHLNSTCMDIGDPHTVTVSHKDDDNEVLVFLPPRSRVLANSDQSTAPSSIISPRIQLSHAAEIFKRHIQPPQWWVNRFSRPQPPRTTIHKASIARLPEQPIQVFLAEAEPEEDLLESLQRCSFNNFGLNYLGRSETRSRC